MGNVVLAQGTRSSSLLSDLRHGKPMHFQVITTDNGLEICPNRQYERDADGYIHFSRNVYTFRVKVSYKRDGSLIVKPFISSLFTRHYGTYASTQIVEMMMGELGYR